MRSCIWGFCKPSLIWLLPGREVTCGNCDLPGILSRVPIGSPIVLRTEQDVSTSVGGWSTAGAFSWVVPYFLSLSQEYPAEYPQPGCVNSLTFICYCRQRSMRCCTISEIVPITQQGESSLLGLPCSGCSLPSSSSTPSSPSSEVARSLRLYPIEFNISSNGVSDFVVVIPAFSALPISSCSCLIAVSALSTLFLATVVFCSTWSSIHFSFSSLLTKCVSHHFPTPRFFLDLTLFNAPRARTVSASKLLLPLFAWWHHHVERFVDLPYLPACSGQRFLLEHWTLHLVLTLLMGEMLDVARYRPHRGKLHLSCRGWYA